MSEIETFRRPLEDRQCVLSCAIKVVETEFRVIAKPIPIILKPSSGSAARVADAAMKPALCGRAWNRFQEIRILFQSTFGGQHRF
jgi:hypothetical protein